jgi:hypothetical protein
MLHSHVYIKNMNTISCRWLLAFLTQKEPCHLMVVLNLCNEPSFTLQLFEVSKLGPFAYVCAI